MPLDTLVAAHLTSLALAALIVTVADYVHFLGLRSRVLEVRLLRSYPHVADLMTALLGFVLLTTGLLVAADPNLLLEPLFRLKLVLLAIAAINGFYLHHKFFPEFFEESDAGRMRKRTLPRTALSGSISIVTWYTLILVSAGAATLVPLIGICIGYLLAVLIAAMFAVRFERIARERRARALRSDRISTSGF